MGEVYKGLTIRIGADTTDFASAIARMNRAISSTDSLLRTLKRATKIDPGNLTVASKSLQVMGEKAVDTKVKLSMMEQEYDKLSKNTRIRELAADSNNLSLKTREVAQALAQATAAITPYNDKLAAIAKAFKMDFDRSDINGFIREFEKLGDTVDETTGEVHSNSLVWQVAREEISRVIDESAELRAEFNSLDAEYKHMLEAGQFKRLGIDMAETEAKTKELVRQLVELQIQERRIGTENSAGIDRMKASMQVAKAATEALKSELSTLDEAIKLDPKNIDIAVQRMKRGQEYADALNSELTILKKELAALNSKGIDDAGRSMKELSDASYRAKENLEGQTRKVVELKSKVGEMEMDERSINVTLKDQNRLRQMAEESGKTQEKIIGELESRQEELRREIDRTNVELKEEERLMRDMSVVAAKAMDTERAAKIRTEITLAESKLRQLNGTLGNIDRKWASIRDLSTSIAAVVSPALLTGLYKVVTSADQIDSAFRDMRKTVNGTEDDFEHLREAAIRFSQTHVTSADQILEIEALGGQLGLAVSELSTFSEVASSLDIATDMNAEDIAEQLGQLNNVLQWNKLSFDDDRGAMERYGDALVRLGNNMPAQESAISEIASRIASQSHIIGMSTPEILGWSTAIASTGQNSEAAATAIARTMADIEGAVAGGGEALEAFAEIAGMGAEEFAKAWEERPSEAMRDFISGLRDLDEQGEFVTQRLADLGITGVRQIQALEGLTNTVDTLDDAILMSKDAWDGVDDQWGAAGDAAREAARKSEGFSGALAILKNNASAFGATVGDSLTKPMQRISSIIQSATGIVEGMDDGMSNLLLRFVGLVGVGAPVLRVFAQMQETMRVNRENARSLGVEQGTLGMKLEKTRARVNELGNGFAILTDKEKIAQTAQDRYTAKLSELQAKMKSLSTSSNTLATKLQLLAARAKAGALQSTFLASALTALKASVGFLVLDIGIRLVSAISEAIKKQKEFNQAVSDFRPKSLDSFKTSIDDASSSMKDMKNATKETVDEINAFHEETRKSEENLAAAVSTMEMYCDIIREASGNMNEMTQKDLTKLQQAIKYVNDATGESISLFDESGNIIESNKQILLDNADAWEKNAQAQAMAAASSGAWEEYYRNLGKIRDIDSQILDIRKTMENIEDPYTRRGLQSQIDDLEKERTKLGELADSTRATAESYADMYNTIEIGSDKSIEAITRLVTSFPAATQVMKDHGVSISELSNGLFNLGVSTADLGIVSSDTWEEIAATYTTSDSIISAVIVSMMEKLAEGSQAEGDFSNLTAAEMDNVVSAYQKMHDDTGITLDEFIKECGEKGLAAVLNEAKGIDAGKRTLESSVDSNVATMRKMDISDEGTNWGFDLISNIAAGIRKGNELRLAGAVNAAASMIYGPLHQSTADYGPLKDTDVWGVHLMQNIINGMRSQQNALRNEALKTAQILDMSPYIEDVKTVSNAVRGTVGAFTMGRQYSSTSKSYTFTGDINIQARDVKEAKDASDVIQLIFDAKNLGSDVEQ